MEYRINKRTNDKISVIGIGSSSISNANKEEAIQTLKYAFENGVNYFDLAAGDAKCFPYYGEAFENVRDKVIYQIHFGANYETGTYGWTTNLDTVKKSIEWQLKELKTDYIDLVLLHQPFSDYYGAYRALEELNKEGKIRAIGISNFYPDRVADISLFGREIVPAVNQIEVNPFNQRDFDKEIMDQYGIQMEAWAPFGEGRNNMFSNETLVNIGKKYGKSAAQVILRWLIQRKVVVVCKSTHIERIEENFNVFDFELSDEDMDEISNLETKNSLFFDHQDPAMVQWFDQMVDIRRGQ